MRWQWTATVVLSTLIPEASAYAAKFERWTLFGLRPLAMGNAYVAVADDYNALFYNPAGLARLKTWDFEFINPFLFSSTNVKGLIDDAQNNLKSGETKDTLDLIQKNTGENFNVGFGLVPHLIFPNFGFGLGIETSIGATFHRDVSVDMDAGARAILPIAFAKNFLDGRLSVGAAVKVRAKVGVDQNFSMDDIEAFGNDKADDSGKELEDYVDGGMGYGADLGMLFTPTPVMEPTLGVSITDLGGTPYKKLDLVGDPVGAPSAQLPSVNVGFSLKPIQREWTYVRTSVDMHSINQPFSASRKLGLGVEGGLGNILKLQGGLYHGYFTAGLQFDIGLFNLKVITYAEELGTVAGYKPDRRYAAQIKFIL